MQALNIQHQAAVQHTASTAPFNPGFNLIYTFFLQIKYNRNKRLTHTLYCRDIILSTQQQIKTGINGAVPPGPPTIITSFFTCFQKTCIS